MPNLEGRSPTPMEVIFGASGDALEKSAKIELICKSQSIEELQFLLREGRFLGKLFPGDMGQFIYPLYMPLFKEFPEVQADAINVLATLGISGDLVREYFTEHGVYPPLSFGFVHGESFTDESYDALCNTAEIIAFTAIKDYLCNPQNPNTT